MPVQLNIEPELLTQALDTLEASLKRQLNTLRNPQFKPIIEEDLKRIAAGKGSITKVK